MINKTMSRPSSRHRRRGDYPPSSFVCPLSLEIMDDPVMDLCAHNFERREIEQWLTSSSSDNCHSCHSYCPISRKPLTVQDLVRNDALAERIEKWKWQQQEQSHLTSLFRMTRRQQNQQRVYSYSWEEEEEDDYEVVENGNHPTTVGAPEEAESSVITMDTTHAPDDDETEESSLEKRSKSQRSDIELANTTNSTWPRQTNTQRTMMGTGAAAAATQTTTKKGIHLPSKKSSTSATARVVESYHRIPTDWMLLPQERRALELVYLQEEEERISVQRKQCQRRTSRLLSIVFLLAIVLLLMVFWRQAKE
jgi:hypothetical protein